ncbi:hypothetical protein IWW54_005621 [Coemansia sp. RSA 2705]|nr:hypothetical protein IWW54_005621 [Coemansia sp. RSA 2705]
MMTNTLAKPLVGGLGGHYTAGQRRAGDAGLDAAASAFALAASPATPAGTGAGMSTGTGMGTGTGTGVSMGASMNIGVPARAGQPPLPPTMAGSYRTDNVAAPRPQQQQVPPSWMLAALPLEVLLGLTAPSLKPKIINDVFFTPEQRRESPQLTPVSDEEAGLLLPSEALDPSADLALFADLQAADARAWAEIDNVCSLRQTSPAATVTSDCEDPGAALLAAHVAQAKSQFACGDSDTVSLSGESCVDAVATRTSLRPTVFEELSQQGVDWCRYCGTTEGINWRPGPWGKRTLCNKHGCDFKGYGFASKMPRLNLKSFMDEPLEARIRPVLQTFCQVCQQDVSEADNVLVQCDGCHRAYHQCCHAEGIARAEIDGAWYCEPACRDNMRRRRILVELPKCRLPYMCSPRHEARPATMPARLPSVPRTRKRKVVCASPEPLEQSFDELGRVRKSSRVARPSIKRLESNYTV